MNSRRSVIAILTVLCLPNYGSAEVRTWTDVSGKFRVNAELVDVTDEAVRLKNASGKVISVPVNRLSAADREYLRTLKASDSKPSAIGSNTPEASIIQLDVPVTAGRRPQYRTAFGFAFEPADSGPLLVTSLFTIRTQGVPKQAVLKQATLLELQSSKKLGQGADVLFLGPDQGSGPGLEVAVLEPTESLEIPVLHFAKEPPNVGDIVRVPLLSMNETRRGAGAKVAKVEWLMMEVQSLRYLGSFMKLMPKDGKFPLFDSNGVPVLNSANEVVGVFASNDLRDDPQFALANSWQDLHSVLKSIDKLGDAGDQDAGSLTKTSPSGKGRIDREPIDQLTKAGAMVTGGPDGIPIGVSFPQPTGNSPVPKLTDDDAELIQRLPTVRIVSLNGTRATDSQLERISQNSNIEELSLWDTGITDNGLSSVTRMTNLTKLKLPRQITDAGLAHLEGMTQLKSLSLSLTGVTDDGMAHVARLTKLESLDITRTHVTDNGIARLVSLKELSRLDLSELPEVTDKAVSSLTKLRKLSDLSVVRTSISEAGKTELQKALPNAEIQWFP